MDQLTQPNPVAAARALAPLIAQSTDAIEQTRRVPAPLVSALHRSRLFRMHLPRSVGGDQVEPGQYLLAVEEISRQDASLGWMLFVANSTALIAPYLDLEVARKIFGAPDSVVAWGPPNACRTQAVDGGYRLTGTWDFASGCRLATWMGAHTLVVEPDGKLRLNQFGRPAIRSFLFPLRDCELHDTWDTLGLRGTASDSYSVKELFVPEAFSSTREDPSLRREPGPLYAFTQQGLYAVGAAGVALGIARAMLEALIELAVKKTPRGLARMADSPVVQADIARAEARIGAARAYLLETLADIYAHADETEPMGVKDRARLRLATTNALHAAIEVCDFTHKAAGVDAIFKGKGPFERRFRDMHTVSQQIQARGAHFETVGQVILGSPPEIFY
jgi:indole-3-acetate monooxygenase